MKRSLVAAMLAALAVILAIPVEAQTLDFANAAYRPVHPARFYQDRPARSAAYDPASGDFIQVSTCYVAAHRGACVTKVNGSTGAVIWAQFLSWSDDSDTPVLAIDASGNAFVAQQCQQAGGYGYCIARLQAAKPELERAIDAAPAIVIMIDAGHRPDVHQQMAWSAALEADWQDPGKKLIPLLLGEAEVPSFLAGRPALRVREPKTEWDHAVGELLGMLRGESEKAGSLLVFADEDPSKRATRLRDIEQAARTLREAS